MPKKAEYYTFLVFLGDFARKRLKNCKNIRF